MSTVNNIPTGLLVPAQVPLDAKLYVADEASLMNLGISNNLAYTYYEGMIVYCVAEKRRYEWRVGAVGETGLLSTGFTYPTPLVVNGIDYSGRTFNFYLVIQNMNVANVGTGITWYKGFNIPANAHQFKSFTSTGLLITAGVNEVNIESKAGENNGGGVEIYKGLDTLSKLHQYRTLTSLTSRITITQVGDQIRINSNFYDTVVTAGAGITVTGAGTSLNPYVVSLTPAASPWLRGDVKWIVCDATYLANNFIASGTTEGLGVNERAGWAICNGKNGTPNDKGRTYIAYGKLGAGTNYATLGATGGEETHQLTEAEIPEHKHIYTADSNAEAKFPSIEAGFPIRTAPSDPYQTASGDGNGDGTTYYTSKTGGSSAHNNMQPYVVRLCIMKL
jgi:hypothetical protein